MSKFRPPIFTAKTTLGEIYGPAMQITDPEEAQLYLDAIVRHFMTLKGPDTGKPKTRQAITKNVKSSLGYFSGYYDQATMQRVFKLFCCEHPVFGSTFPTPTEAFKAGEKLGKKLAVKEPRKVVAKKVNKTVLPHEKALSKLERMYGVKVVSKGRKLAKKGRK